MGCPPAVALDGDAELVVVVARLIETDGYDRAQGTCLAEHASLARVADRIVVAIADRDGRRVVRTVDDVATAAVVIESFAGDYVPDAPAPAPRRSVAAVDVEVPAAPPAVRSSRARDPVFDFAGETSFASDRSLWVGARAGACIPIGLVCAGAVARYIHDTAEAGAAEDFEVHREGVDLLVGGQLRLERGRWTLAPSAYVGLGWLRTSPEAMPTVNLDIGGLRAEMGVAATLHVTGGLGIRFGAALDATPFAHGATQDLPAEPSSLMRAEIGIEVR